MECRGQWRSPTDAALSRHACWRTYSTVTSTVSGWRVKPRAYRAGPNALCSRSCSRAFLTSTQSSWRTCPSRPPSSTVVCKLPRSYLDHQVYEYGGALVAEWDTVDAPFPGGFVETAFSVSNRLLGTLADEESWEAPNATSPYLPRSARIEPSRFSLTLDTSGACCTLRSSPVPPKHLIAPPSSTAQFGCRTASWPTAPPPSRTGSSRTAPDRGSLAHCFLQGMGADRGGARHLARRCRVSPDRRRVARAANPSTCWPRRQRTSP